VRKNCECCDALVVEDNAFSAYCLQKHLSELGLRVDIAASGHVAREKIGEMLRSRCCSMYKFIFIDHNLGDCVGPNLVLEMRQIIQENLLERFPLMVACTGNFLLFHFVIKLKLIIILNNIE
jgi:CheY-like chemotaxis protein